MSKRIKVTDMTEPELKDLMDRLAGAVVLVCDIMGVEDPLFSLLLWNDPYVAQYVSNAEKESTINALKEFLSRIENNEVIPR